MDIKEEILTFINREEETGALLITGKWGSGKSYYIKGLATATPLWMDLPTSLPRIIPT